MDIEINMWAVVAAALSSFAVGMIWYMPGVFGETWRKLVGLDKKAMKKGPGGRAWLLTVLAAFLQAGVLAHVAYLVYSFDADKSFASASIMAAVAVWAGFQLSLLLTHDSFEQRRLKLTMINATHQLVTLVVMGAIIGAIGVN